MTATKNTPAANRELVTGMYEAAKRGDFSAFLEPLAADIVVMEPGFLPYGGTYRGMEELQALLVRVSGILDVTGMVVEQLICDGDHVIGLIRVPVVGTASEVSLAELSVIRDGKIIEMRIFFHEAGPLIAPLAGRYATKG